MLCTQLSVMRDVTFSVLTYRTAFVGTATVCIRAANGKMCWANYEMFRLPIICLGLFDRCTDGYTGHRCFHHNRTSSHISVQCKYFICAVHANHLCYVVVLCSTIRDAILTCAQKPTRVSLIYRTEMTTEKCKIERKFKSKDGYARCEKVSSLGESCSENWRKKRKGWLVRSICRKGRY